MAIKRNIKKFLQEEYCPLDDVMGDRGWRKFQTGREIIEYYRKKLVSLGYQEVKIGEEIPVRSIAKNLPLYCLLFASKHSLGHKFWQEVSKVDEKGQGRLPL